MLDAIFEFFLELFFTPIIEGIVDFVGRIIPKEKIPNWLFWIIKITFSLLLIAAIGALFIGLFAFFGAEDETDKIIGKRLLTFGFITVAIFVVIRIFTPNTKDDEDLNDEQ